MTNDRKNIEELEEENKSIKKKIDSSRKIIEIASKKEKTLNLDYQRNIRKINFQKLIGQYFLEYNHGAKILIKIIDVFVNDRECGVIIKKLFVKKYGNKISSASIRISPQRCNYSDFYTRRYKKIESLEFKEKEKEIIDFLNKE